MPQKITPELLSFPSCWYCLTFIFYYILPGYKLVFLLFSLLWFLSSSQVYLIRGCWSGYHKAQLIFLHQNLQWFHTISWSFQNPWSGSYTSLCPHYQHSSPSSSLAFLLYYLLFLFHMDDSLPKLYTIFWIQSKFSCIFFPNSMSLHSFFLHLKLRSPNIYLLKSYSPSIPNQPTN